MKYQMPNCVMPNFLPDGRRILYSLSCLAIACLLVISCWATGAHACDQAKVAVAPILVHDPFFSDEIARALSTSLFSKLGKKCKKVEILDQDITRAKFDRVGISSYFEGRGHLMTIEQVHHIAKSTGATHFAFSNIDRDNDLISVKVYLVEDYELIQSPVLSWSTSFSELSRNLPQTNRELNIIAFLSPNSVTYGFSNTNIFFNPAPGYSNTDNTYRTNLPRVISSIGFTKIEHYRTYRLLDYGGSLFPRSFLFGIDQVSRFDKQGDTGSPAETHEFHVQSYGGCGIISGEGSIHTPIGTTFAELGFGLCAMQSMRESKNPIYKGSLAYTFGFGHRAFFAENWFFQMSVETLNLETSLYRNRYVKAHEIQRTLLGVGHYFPDSEHQFASLWQKIMPEPAVK